MTLPDTGPDRMRTTLLGAIDALVAEGFTEHFGVRGHQLCGFESGVCLEPSDVVIRGFSRFEGVSDPGDMSIVYAIEGRDGLRGTLVDAFGVYSDPIVSAFVQEVSIPSRDRAGWMPPP
ncbi:MAG: phosphoribosylpyrophosphate synthetase [Candidatus Rokuibacteriota bacterium]|nr:MAG: phosphoribosylpyrophosphate synthetase [Candidatus Rokubacteria bacterium]